MSDSGELIERARKLKLAVPAFNIPYIAMVKPVARAIADAGTFALIQVARLEWEKFESVSLEAIRDEYEKWKDERFMRLHLDHVPVVDEDGVKVDFLQIIRRALSAGYQSVMVDGSRMNFRDNVAATKSVVDLAHAVGVPVEAELGSVLGHEAGPLPPYEELFASGKGFTDPAEAAVFVAATGVDWLSVSIGNIHGAISASARKEKKLEARLDLERLSLIATKAKLPLVLHGGTGIRGDNIIEGMHRGIAKINIGTAIRAAYESAREKGETAARDAVYTVTLEEIYKMELGGSAAKLGLGS